MNQVLVVLGPTAVGKTSFILKLAEQVKGEIISADSKQVYQNLDIATAKPGLTIREKIPHHLIDIKKPTETFSVAEFKKLALEKINIIFNKEKTPIISGGTGLYIKALIEDFKIPQVAPDHNYREKLNKMPLSTLQKMLKKRDFPSYQHINLKNKLRVVRALEVNKNTQESFWKLKNKQKTSFNFTQIGLWRPRKILYRRINNRVEKMLSRGLVEEIKSLMKISNLSPAVTSTLGYKQIASFIKGNISLEEAISLLQRDTRRYAKRQLTWFRHQKNISWLPLWNP